MDETKKNSLLVGSLIIGSAIIWGAVILGCSIALKGTECYSKIQYAVFGGTFAHIIFIWGPMAVLFNKVKTNVKNEDKAN